LPNIAILAVKDEEIAEENDERNLCVKITLKRNLSRFPAKSIPIWIESNQFESERKFIVPIEIPETSEIVRNANPSPDTGRESRNPVWIWSKIWVDKNLAWQDRWTNANKNFLYLENLRRNPSDFPALSASCLISPTKE
jgi:hypothetical protein